MHQSGHREGERLPRPQGIRPSISVCGGAEKRRNQEGDIAQLGERTTEVHQESNRAVPGSIPGGATLFAYGAYLHLPTS